MMNKQKTSKSWIWKVATFLPLLALLLMAFGKPEYVNKAETVVQPENINVNRDLQESKGGTVSGTVVFSDGKPLQGIGVRVKGMFKMTFN